MSERRFTEKQIEAMLFLPADGSPVTKVGGMSAGLYSLEMRHRDLIKIEFGEFGPRGGRCARYQLTSAGIEARRNLEPRHG